MAKNRFAELREKTGLTQSALAKKMNVTRQTISGWETGRTEPDIESMSRLAEIFGTDMNEITGFPTVKTLEETPLKKPHFELILAAAFIPVIAASALSVQSDNIFILWIMLLCAFATVIPLSFMAKSGDFTMLAGYDKNAEYNKSEICKMLYSMCTHICTDTLVYAAVLAFCGIIGYGKLVTVVVTIAYAINFLLSVLLISKKYESTVYISKPNTENSKEFNAVAVPYIILIVIQSVVLPLKCLTDSSHGVAVVLFFIAAAAETMWLVYELMRKENTADYKPRKKLLIAIIGICAACTAAMLI